MNEVVIAEYVELSEQIAAEALFSERIEQKLSDRLDQIWYAEMSIDDRIEALRQLRDKARAWEIVRPAEVDS